MLRLSYYYFSHVLQPQRCIAFSGVLEGSFLRRSLSAINISTEVMPISVSTQPKPKQPTETRKREAVTNHLLRHYKNLSKSMEVPSVMGGEEIFTNDMQKVNFPHEHKCRLAHVYYANRCQIENAIKYALAAQGTWSLVPAIERLQIWRRAADIIERDPTTLTAVLVLGVGKTIVDAENDVRRMISAIRSNADYLEHLSQLRFEIQAEMTVFPSFNLRPMDGFVAAIGSYESICIATTLALCPALMGNTVLWNPALEIAPASYIVYKAFLKAGLPKSVISFVPANERLFLDTITDAIHFSGINFHGDAANYRHMYKQVGDKIERYICFPRLVAECRGKNFHFVHRSANLQTACQATIEAAFNFAGQYSNSLSRLYVASSVWPELRKQLQIAIENITMGDPSLPQTNIGPVVNKDAFQRIKALIQRGEYSNNVETICGGTYDDSVGYFINPTIAVLSDPLDPLLSEPIVGPFLPVFVYADDSLTEALNLAAHQSKYALSGSIFAQRDEVIAHCLSHLRMSASNLYVNERCTGNPSGLTPFGGNRLSGTNDKSGSAYFLMRWSSPLLVEETIKNTIKI